MACQQGEQNPRNFSPLRFHLGFILWSHRQRGSSNEFWGHRKSKERWSSRGEKKREKERMCIGNKGVSLLSHKINKLLLCLWELKKNTRTHTQTYQTHSYLFLHFKICYLIQNTKHIFCIMNTLNACFNNIF